MSVALPLLIMLVMTERLLLVQERGSQWGVLVFFPVYAGAEHVETRECLAILKELGVDDAQGFALGRPAAIAFTA